MRDIFFHSLTGRVVCEGAALHSNYAGCRRGDSRAVAVQACRASSQQFGSVYQSHRGAGKPA